MTSSIDITLTSSIDVTLTSSIDVTLTSNCYVWLETERRRNIVVVISRRGWRPESARWSHLIQCRQ